MKKLLKSFSILFIFISCTNFNNIGKIDNDDNFVAPPDMEFYGFIRESYDTNFKQLNTFATNAKFYNEKKIIELYDSKSYTYDSNGNINASISGDFIIIDQNTLYIEIYTNVVAKTSNNTTLYTEYLEYNSENQHFKSPVAIRVENEDGSWLTGSSMEGDLAEENIIIYNEIDEGKELGVEIEK